MFQLDPCHTRPLHYRYSEFDEILPLLFIFSSILDHSAKRQKTQAQWRQEKPPHESCAGALMGLFVKRRVGKVDVFLVHLLLGQTHRLAEALEVNDLPLTQEADDVVTSGSSDMRRMLS